MAVGHASSGARGSLHEGGHSNNRSVFPGGIVHFMPTKSREGSKERNTLRLTSTVDSPNDELSLVCEKGEQYTNCKGQEMEVSAFSQGMGSKPLDQLRRGFTMTGGQPAWGLATNG